MTDIIPIKKAIMCEFSKEFIDVIITSHAINITENRIPALLAETILILFFPNRLMIVYSITILNMAGIKMYCVLAIFINGIDVIVSNVRAIKNTIMFL